MEFIQFHPTCLYHPHAKTFLITEAVRGEGGQLKLPAAAGQPPLHARPRRARRTGAARRGGARHRLRDEEARPGLRATSTSRTRRPEFLQEHFPNILARCAELGIDITKEPIPVVPAAHYTCGGVLTDLAGRTDLAGLYAVGETACTGLHGANRLASNSLVECMVFAQAAVAAHRQRATARAAGAAAVGRQPRDRRRRGGGDLAQLGRAAPLHVGLRGHRAHQQAPGARRPPHHPAAGRNPRVLRPLPRHPRPAGAAQPGAGGRPDRQVGQAAPRKPRPAFQPRLSRPGRAEAKPTILVRRRADAPVGKPGLRCRGKWTVARSSSSQP